MDDLTLRRMRHNEELFREINERVDEVRAPAAGADPTAYVCECADPTCTERVPLRPDEYGGARANERRFFVVRGHERPEVETVVGGGDGYLLVEKRPR
jgi:hypothetical protein